MIQKLDKYVNDIKFNGISINRIYLNGDVYWGGDVSSFVPTYEILDYISTPTRTYIDSGIYVNDDTVVEMTAMFTSRILTSRQNQRFYSSHDNDQWNARGTWSMQFEDLDYKLAVKRYGYPDPVYPNVDPVLRTTLKLSNMYNQKWRYNHTAKGVVTIYDENDSVVYNHDFGYLSYQSSSTTIELFAFRPGDTNVTPPMNIYSFKIWNGSDCVRDYIPVKRLSDDICGLYDKTTQTFFDNEAQGYYFTGTSKSVPEYI